MKVVCLQSKKKRIAKNFCYPFIVPKKSLWEERIHGLFFLAGVAGCWLRQSVVAREQIGRIEPICFSLLAEPTGNVVLTATHKPKERPERRSCLAGVAGFEPTK